eukprot:jgi/Picsp_1/1091/NSC_04574-R1_---NA---
MTKEEVSLTEIIQVTVKVIFGNKALDPHSKVEISLDKAGNESILDVKEKITKSIGGSTKASDLMLNFGPNDRKLGKQFVGDPTVDEGKLLIKDFSILSWLERFPHWTLSVSLLPPTPPAPGVAVKKAAAMAENKDPEKAVEEGRDSGEIPRISDLPAPWGPKKYEQPSYEDLVQEGYLPAKYPSESSPLLDV